jgi:hypothetical protein
MGLAASSEAAAQRWQRKTLPRLPTRTRPADHLTFVLQRVQIVRLDGLKWAFRIPEKVLHSCAELVGRGPMIILHFFLISLG